MRLGDPLFLLWLLTVWFALSILAGAVYVLLRWWYSR